MKELTGNPGKRPLNRQEPKPTATVPRCPDWLDDEARQRWAELIPELGRLGIVTSIDGDALAAYCQAWAEFRKATETLRKEGNTFTTDTGQVKSHPCVSQQRSAWAAIKAFASLFGLDPSSRSRLSIQKGDADELEEFLNGSADRTARAR